MKILAGAVTAANATVLDAHLKTMLWQDADAEVTLIYLTDPAITDEAKAVLTDATGNVYPADDKPEGADYSIDSETHRWTMPTFEWLAREKQKLLNHARANGYDAIWLVDSDLLCAPDTLRSMLSVNQPIVSGVFWTHWTPQAPPLPQVWLSHPYELQGKGQEFHEFIAALANRELVQVGGLGACTLIRTSVLDKVGYFPLVPGLPQGGMWQGEDRHFCVRAERRHVPMFADAWPDIWHCYRPEDEAKIEEFLSRETERITDVEPVMGDLVSLSLTPCEEPALSQHTEHIRGRLGQLKLVPDLERIVQDMKPGDVRLPKIRFPLWYPLPQYRGQERIIRIQLHGCKSGALPPTLAESVYAEDPTHAFQQFYRRPA